LIRKPAQDLTIVFEHRKSCPISAFFLESLFSVFECLAVAAHPLHLWANLYWTRVIEHSKIKIHRTLCH